MTIFTPEMVQYLKDNAEGLYYTELTEKFNKHFNVEFKKSSISYKCVSLGIKTNKKEKYKPKFTPEMTTFLVENIKGTHYEKLTAELNERFGVDIDIRSVMYKCHRLGIKSGLQGKNYKEKKKLLNKEQYEYFLSIQNGLYSNQVAEKINEKFGLNITEEQIKGLRKRKKINSGLTGRYGERTPDGILIQYQECSKKNKTYKVGEERIVHWRTLNYSHIEIKISENPTIWKPKHIIVYESVYGKVPKDYVIMFKNQNPLDCDINNLMLIKKTDLCRANRYYGLVKGSAEVNELIIAASKLKGAIKDSVNKKDSNK